jgi:hypothetical protein
MLADHTRVNAQHEGELVNIDPCEVVGFNYDPTNNTLPLSSKYPRLRSPVILTSESVYLEIPYAQCLTAREDAAQMGFK